MSAEKVALESEVPESGMLTILRDSRQIVLCRVGGEIHAFDGVCPHRGANLGQGTLDGSVLTCPWHQWQFDVCTGGGLTNPHAGVRKYTVVVVNGEVAVE